METLQSKREGTGVISVRLPGPVYWQLIEQRQRAKQLGFSFNQTLAEILNKGAEPDSAALPTTFSRVRMTRTRQSTAAAARHCTAR